MKALFQFLCYFLGLLAFPLSMAWAAPGDLDKTFGNQGRVPNRSGDLILDIAVQSDGRILTLGGGLVRYETDGRADMTFGDQGMVGPIFGNYSYDYRSMLLQEDGRILVAGEINRYPVNNCVVARFNSDGSPDLSFGNGGWFLRPSGFHAMALQKDGKIVLAGETLDRYRSDGSLDQSFGSNGQAPLNVGEVPRAMTVLDNGKILMTGGTGDDSNSNLALSCYNSDGSPDRSFGMDGNGRTVVDFGADHSHGDSLIVQEDGKTVVAGKTWSDNQTSFTLARFMPDGSPDLTFSGGSFRVFTSNYRFPSSVTAAVSLQKNGKILLASATLLNSSFNIVLGRFNTDGSPDMGFGSGGLVTTNISDNIAGAVAQQEDWKILVGGHSSLFRFDNVPPPLAVTLAVTDVTSTGATLNGTVNALAEEGGGSTDVFFEYSSDGVNYLSVPAFPATVTGSGATPVSTTLIGLVRGARYHFRVKGVSAAGAVSGVTLAFRPFDGPDPLQPGPSFQVTTTEDHDDGEVTLQDCSLREAIHAANAAGGPHTITFSKGLAGTILLNSLNGQLIVSSPLTLIGPGADLLAVSGGDAIRVMTFTSGPHYVSGLTLKNGKVGATFWASAEGGGVLNSGTLAMEYCVLANNRAQGGLQGGDGLGGGLSNSGHLTLRYCTFRDNIARGGDGPSAGNGRGGAISNRGRIVAENCTFTRNAGQGGIGTPTTTGGFPGGGPVVVYPGTSGGGIGGISSGGDLNLNGCTFTENSGSGRFGYGAIGGRFPSRIPDPASTAPLMLTMTSCTLSRNQGTSSNPGGIASYTSNSFLKNVICADNTGGDLSGAFVSGGFNLIGNIHTATGINDPTDRSGTLLEPLRPLLGPMQYNGGPTETMALLPGSPALDRGKSFSLSTDQRRGSRTYDDPAIINGMGSDGTDIGAVEMQPASTGEMQMGAITFCGPVARILFHGMPGVKYQLECSDRLSSFASCGEIQTADASGVIDFLDAGPLPLTRYYRAAPVP